MSTLYRTKNSYLSIMKPWCCITFLIMLFLSAGIQKTSGQVKAEYDEKNKTITVKNQSGRDIVLFGKNCKFNKKLQSGYMYDELSKFRSEKQTEVLSCMTGIPIKNKGKERETLTIIKGESEILDNVKSKPKHLFYYSFEKNGSYNYIKPETERVEVSSNSQLPAVEPSPKAEPPKAEPPKVEPPKVELPKIELPKVEPPKVELLKVEPIKVEPPKEETPTHKDNGTQPQPPKDGGKQQPPKDGGKKSSKDDDKKPKYKAMDNTKYFNGKITDLRDRSEGKILRDSVILNKLLNEAGELRSKIENEIKSLLNKEKDTCSNCEELIESYRIQRDELHGIGSEINKILAEGRFTDDIKLQIEEEAEHIIKQFGNYNITLNNIRDVIKDRSRNTLAGWIGKKEIYDRLDELKNSYGTVNVVSTETGIYKNENAKKYLESLTATVSSNIPEKYTEIEKCKTALDRIEVPYVLLSLIGILLLLSIIGIYFYTGTILKNKRIRKIEEAKRAADAGRITIEEDDTVTFISYTVGLSEVKEKAGMDFYEIDMSAISEDTSIGTVYFSRKCILDIYKFFTEFLKNDKITDETGCYLIGRWEYVQGSYQQAYDISIESLVKPSDDAVYGEYNLDFGAKIGVSLDYAIENMCEKTGKEYVHIAWMHSHPGLGLFLSSQDVNVQSQLSHSQHRGRMLAIVIDSNSPDLEMAFFTPKKSGMMNNNKDLIQTLSLETLYQWAKTSPSNIKTQTGKQSYFEIPVLSETDKIDKILFSGSAIIDMDTTIMPDTQGLQGYFYGKNHPKTIVIDSFNEREQDAAIGCLLVVQNFSLREIQMDYIPVMNRFDCSIIYCINDGNVYVLTKNEQKKYLLTDNQTTSASLMKMKEWTRRKR